MREAIYTYIFFINVVGFLTMYIDKRRAIKKKWRISESTLIIIAIAGGSIGSFAGMKMYRHKTKHLKFIVGIPVIIFVQLGILTYLLG